jgi:hypothetical protein
MPSLPAGVTALSTVTTQPAVVTSQPAVVTSQPAGEMRFNKFYENRVTDSFAVATIPAALPSGLNTIFLGNASVSQCEF